MANFFSEGGGNENKSRNKQEGVEGEMITEKVRWGVIVYIFTSKIEIAFRQAYNRLQLSKIRQSISTLVPDASSTVALSAFL
jgi:hypothetical protein